MNLNTVIWILVFGTMAVVSLTQNGTLPKTGGYVGAGVLCAITMGVALVRYRREKAAGK